MERPDDPVRDPDRRRSGGPVSRWGDGRFVVEGDGEEIGNPRSGSLGGGPACLRLMAALSMGKVLRVLRVPDRDGLLLFCSVFRLPLLLLPSSLVHQCRLGPSRIDPIKLSGDAMGSPVELRLLVPRS